MLERSGANLRKFAPKFRNAMLVEADMTNFTVDRSYELATASAINPDEDEDTAELIRADVVQVAKPIRRLRPVAVCGFVA